jgi:hypothetical protein
MVHNETQTMDHDNALTYNVTYCLGYILDHDNGLTYNLACCFGYIMDHDNSLTNNMLNCRQDRCHGP